MFRKTIFALLTVSLLLLTVGCGGNSSGKATGDSNEPGETLGNLLWSIPAGYKNEDGLLSAVGMFKFGEYAEVGPEHLNLYSKTQALQGLTEFYVPGYIKQGFALSGIEVNHTYSPEGMNGINILNTLYYEVATGNTAYFEWCCYVLPENISKGVFYSGASEEYWEERNNINYAVTEWVKRATQEPDGFLIAWVQHGQSFLASLPAGFTLDEALAFCDLQPVEAWELWGDAVSVSVQGIDGVSILDDNGAAITESDGVLYRIDADSGEMERIGYKWLIDEDSSRYQYVLEPGEYSFSADKIKKGAGLLVKHFESGDIVSSVDYAKKLSSQSAKPLYLEVTTNPNDTLVTDKIPSSVSVE